MLFRSMFLKKLTLLRTGRRVSMHADDMSADVFTRNAHAVQLGNKAFNMSQPMLGVRMNLDNEDHSDVSPTSCSSPTSGSHKQPDSASSAVPSKQLPSVHSDIAIVARVDAPLGLPSTSERIPSRNVDGLPASGGQQSTAVSKPVANEAASARSIVATASVKSGLTDSDSHESSDVSLIAWMCVTSSDEDDDLWVP